ncbi:hypothetical protein F9K85_07005 [Brucella tritici]|uniref:Uncharacterized protein n=2 Tax=Brucella TaxID=234 RepID=A0A6L3YXB9_9HYPH|nr:hypothetical protein F9K91_06090 [Brucella tritici]KAB2677706.1 hypothetical protein F9K85_07005 [Brucella tritici]KAB2690189.1 hypothetical protein F9L08_01585 [Brucella tritici]PQA72607.1 hypothetical protein C3731_16100 [Brucella oryzae]
MKLRLTHFREKWESVFRWKCAGNFLERALPVDYNTGSSRGFAQRWGGDVEQEETAGRSYAKTAGPSGNPNAGTV